MKPNEEPQAAMNQLLNVKKTYEQQLLGKPNVVGVGIGYAKVGGVTTDTLALVVLVTQKVPPARLGPGDQIPPVIEGVPVDVQEVGKIVAL
jgi:hypothetical protein